MKHTVNPDWNRINSGRLRRGQFSSANADGFNGAFSFALPGEARRIFVIASDGLGWRHVSVSFGPNKSIPSWHVMCQIKDIFFGKDAWVIQFHAAQSEHVNNHPGCLHLWQPTESDFPVPEKIMVGIQELGTIS